MPMQKLRQKTSETTGKTPLRESTESPAIYVQNGNARFPMNTIIKNH